MCDLAFQEKGKLWRVSPIRMVIASLVTVALEQAVRAIPGLTGVSAIVESMNVIIGGALTIARAICAVHYGRVMHLLHPDDASAQPSSSVVEELVRQAVEEMAATIRAEQHQALTQMQQGIERRLPMLHDAASASTPLLGAMLQDQTGAMGDAGQRQGQPLVVLESPGDANRLGPEPPDQSQDHQSRPVALSVASTSKPEPPFRASATPNERLQAAYDLLTTQGQRISGRALAREAHVNRTTASTWLTVLEARQVKPAVVALTDGENEATC